MASWEKHGTRQGSDDPRPGTSPPPDPAGRNPRGPRAAPSPNLPRPDRPGRIRDGSENHGPARQVLSQLVFSSQLVPRGQPPAREGDPTAATATRMANLKRPISSSSGHGAARRSKGIHRAASGPRDPQSHPIGTARREWARAVLSARPRASEPSRPLATTTPLSAFRPQRVTGWHLSKVLHDVPKDFGDPFQNPSLTSPSLIEPSRP
jgi:hypothetical protein